MTSEIFFIASMSGHTHDYNVLHSSLVAIEG